jgi:hypothetical protein
LFHVVLRKFPTVQIGAPVTADPVFVMRYVTRAPLQKWKVRSAVPSFTSAKNSGLSSSAFWVQWGWKWVQNSLQGVQFGKFLPVTVGGYFDSGQ